MKFRPELSHDDRIAVPVKTTRNYEIYSGYFGKRLRPLKPMDEGMVRSINGEGVEDVEFLPFSITPAFDLTVLKQLPALRLLSIHSEVPLDWSPLQDLCHLRALKLKTGGIKPQVLNFKAFKKLESCSLDLHAEWDSILQCKSLRHLTVENARGRRVFDFSELPLLRELRAVRCSGLSEIIFSPYQKIESIEVTATRTFRTIQPIEIMRGVKYLAFGGNVRFDIDQVGRCRNLEKLWLNSVGKIPSLQFLAGCKDLKYLQMLFSANVQDGQLEILATLPRLQTVRYKYRAHYSHRQSDLNGLLRREPS